MNRENIYAALFNVLPPLLADGFVTLSRRLEFVEKVDPSRMPGVWQLQVDETPAGYTTEGVALWNFDVDWYIYAGNNDPDSPNSPIFNPLVDKVMALLPRDVNGVITGTFKVDGVPITLTLRDKVTYWEGLINNRMVVVIPLRLLVPYGG